MQFLKLHNAGRVLPSPGSLFHSFGLRYLSKCFPHFIVLNLRTENYATLKLYGHACEVDCKLLQIRPASSLWLKHCTFQCSSVFITPRCPDVVLLCSWIRNSFLKHSDKWTSNVFHLPFLTLISGKTNPFLTLTSSTEPNGSWKWDFSG